VLRRSLAGYFLGGVYAAVGISLVHFFP